MEGSYWLDIHVSQADNKPFHCRDVIVDPAKKDRLVSHGNTLFKELLRSVLGGPGDFIRMVEVGMQRNRLAHLFPHIGNSNQSRAPCITRIKNARWANSKALGCVTEAFNVRDREETFTDIVELFRGKVIRVSTRNHDVV